MYNNLFLHICWYFVSGSVVRGIQSLVVALFQFTGDQSKHVTVQGEKKNMTIIKNYSMTTIMIAHETMDSGVPDSLLNNFRLEKEKL